MIMLGVHRQLVKTKSMDKKEDLNFLVDCVKSIMPSTIVLSWTKLKESWITVLLQSCGFLHDTRNSCRVHRWLKIRLTNLSCRSKNLSLKINPLSPHQTKVNRLRQQSNQSCLRRVHLQMILSPRRMRMTPFKLSS